MIVDRATWDLGVTSLLIGILSITGAGLSAFLVETTVGNADPSYGRLLAGCLVATAGFVFAVVAAVVGVVALRRQRDGWEYQRSMASAGLGSGLVAAVPCLLLAGYSLFLYSVRITF